MLALAPLVLTTLAFSYPHLANAQTEPVKADSRLWFPFSISAYDDQPGELDLSHLNDKPAGKHGFIKARGESLTDDRGLPWRYFGTNLTAEACFPDEEQARKLAAHFAKSGLNLVRFHFMDENWSGVHLVRKDGQPGLNEEALARLDYFFAELKKHGIYANLNLHVGRKYPDQPKEAPDMSKGIDNIYPPYADALKQYARDLLTHVNPHTGLAYVDDPAVAIVEVNNENTLLMNSFWPAKISGPVKEHIQKSWTQWAAMKYNKDMETLWTKWGTRSAENGPNLLKNGELKDRAAGWYLDNQGEAKSNLSPGADGKGVRLTAAKAGSANWHTQLIQSQLNLQNGRRYRLRFQARADADHTIYVNTQQSVAPYGVAGLWTEVKLTREWQNLTYTFTARDAQAGKVNLVFGPNGNTGWFEFADVYLDEYSDGFLTRSADFNSAEGLPLPDQNANKAVLRDYFAFLAEEELNYAKEMHRFLKEDLKVKCLVAHSHIFFGALLGVRREGLVSDVVHANAYWHHPHFPRGQWDPNDWEINQQVLSQDPLGGVLAELAVQRPAGKPFALTEWDIPAPIDSLAEGLPLLAAFASYQGWSGLTLYTFSHSTADFASDHYHSFFDYTGHPGKRSGIPFAAFLFRTGAVEAGTDRMRLTVSREALLDDIAEHEGSIWANWRRFYSAAGLDGSQAIKKPTEIVITEDAEATKVEGAASPEAPAISSTKQITWGSADKVARVISPLVLFASGQLGGQTHDLGPCSVKVSALDGDGFAVWGLLALDGKPLDQSKKLLGLALRRSENEGMDWRADRKTVGNRWGKGPSLVLGFEAEVTLPGDADWKISALDPSGKIKQSTGKNTDVWKIQPEAETVWWLLERQ